MDNSINKFAFKKAFPYLDYMILLYDCGLYLIVSKEDFNAHWARISTSCWSYVKAFYSLDFNL